MSSVQFKLDVNDNVNIKGQIWKVHSFTANGDHNLVNSAENRFELKTGEQLQALWEAGHLEKVPIPANENFERRVKNLDVPFDSWPDNIKSVARQRYWYVRGYKSRNLRRPSKEILEKMIQEVANDNKDDNPPSVRQLRRWLHLWRELGCPELNDIRILAPLFNRRGNRIAKFHHKVETIMEEVIDELYLCMEPKTLEEVRQEIRARVKRIDFSDFDPQYMDGNFPKIPGRSTISRMVHTIDFDVRVDQREGRYARIRKCEPVILGPRPKRALEEVEIDHTLTDWILFDYKRMVPLGRPWLTLIVDRATRCILAYLLTFKKPGAAEVLRCMKMMMTPKSYMKDRYPGVVNPWVMWGKPGTVIVDNGAEFHSANFLDNLFVHQIDMQACPVYTPQMKGRVERAIRTTMEGLCHKVPGTTFSNIVKRGDYESEKLAVIDEEVAHYLIHKFICDIYHRRIHRSLGMTPAQKWDECVEKYGPPRPPARIKDINELALSFEYRPLTREGIHIHGLTYCDKSDALRTLLNRGDKPELIKVRYDPADLSYVLIEDWRSHQFIRVPSLYPDYTTDLSLDAHEVYQEYVKQRKKENERVSVEELMEARHAIYQKLKFLVKHKKKLGKKLEGVFGGDVISKIVDEISEESIAVTIQEEEDRLGEVIDISDAPRAPKRRKPTKAEREEIKAKVALDLVEVTSIAVAARKGAAHGISADFD